MLKSLRRVIFTALLISPTFAATASNTQPNVVLRWTDATLAGIRDSNLGAPVGARALATVETCMYDAWAAYDDKAVGTGLHGALRRPAGERTDANKQEAISYAGFQALKDVLPVDTDSLYRPLMQELGYHPDNHSRDIETAAGIAHVACGAVLELRHHDRSNQLGDLAPGAYSDWTRYAPLNLPLYVNGGAVPVTNIEHWQPLTYVDEAGNLETQRFVGAQWCYVTPFALKNGDQFRSLMQRYGPASKDSAQFREQAEELIRLSAGLTDRQKMIAEYWEDGAHSEQPPGHWARFAESVSIRDKHSLGDDVKVFFALSNAMLERRHRGVGYQARLRFGPSHHRHTGALPRPENSRLGRTCQGNNGDGWLQMAALSAFDTADARVPGVCLRPQHIQRRSRSDPAARHRSRPLRKVRNLCGGFLEVRAWSHPGTTRHLAMEDFHGSRGRGGLVAALWRNSLQGR